MKNNNTYFRAYSYSVGTQHGNLHPLSVTMSRMTYFILRAHTGTGASHSQRRNNLGEVLTDSEATDYLKTKDGARGESHCLKRDSNWRPLGSQSPESRLITTELRSLLLNSILSWLVYDQKIFFLNE